MNTKTAPVTHTRGPWDDASNYPGIDSVRIFSKTHYIATVGNSDDPRDVTEANARLIAAAPDLLEAAKHAAMEWRLHGQLTDSCRVLEAAIAKAVDPQDAP